MDKPQLLAAYRFLEKVAQSNEATEYDPSDEPIIHALADMVTEEKQAAIAEDFNKPFLHPMVTVQQHVDELKELVRQALKDQ